MPWNSKWTQIPGSLSRISVAHGGGHVVGLDPGGRIFYYQGGEWSNDRGKGLPAGILSEISVGDDGLVYGLTADGAIFSRGPLQWDRVPGALTRISAATGNNVWGVNADGNIFRSKDLSTGPYIKWERIPGTLADVSVRGKMYDWDNSMVWGVQAGGNILKYNGAGGWTPVYGSLKKVCAMGGWDGTQDGAVGISSSGIAWFYIDRNGWTEIVGPGGALIDCGVSIDTTMWVVNESGNIFQTLLDA